MANDELLYKLWLNIVCGHNPGLIGKYIDKLGSARAVYETKSFGKGLLSGVIRNRIENASRSLDEAKELENMCAENGIEIIAIDDERYPRRLAEVYCPPQILYVKGELPDIDNLVTIAIVGSRHCSDYSRKFAGTLAGELTANGVLVISGMALGIDGAAHAGALNAGGVTVAVLAGGVDVVYPKANKNLYDEIIERGAVISEMPPGMVGRAEFYRQRNRILAGLSSGVVIAEGEQRSGTKLTANWAISSNRDVFAVPGKPGERGTALPNQLIKDSAKLITSAEDVLEEYIYVYPEKLKKGIELIVEDRAVTVKPETSENEVLKKLTPIKPDLSKLEGNQRIVADFLQGSEGAVHADDIARECGISTAELSMVIIQLLMQRIITEHPGGYYSI